MFKGRLASNSRSVLRMAAASCVLSRSERTTRQVWMVGDCRNGRKIAGFGFSVSLKYFPSSTIPTTCARDQISERGRAEGEVHEISGQPIGQPLHGRALALGAFDGLDDLAVTGVA